MKKVGIFGGTFDPIHYGHLLVAENVIEQVKLDGILFIPTGMPPHKNENLISAKEHRFKMTELAISDNSHFKISPIEINRIGVCYTIDTINQLYKMYTDTEFFYIVGADALNDMTGWKSPKELFEKIKIIAINRVSNESNIEEIVEEITQEYDADITIVKMPLIEISSTEIRNRIKNKLSVKYMLPNVVIDYVEKNDLYFGG